MIFELQKIEGDINKINEVPLVFLEHAQLADVCDENIVPDWFKPVYTRCPGVKDKFATFYKDFKAVDKPKQDFLINLYKNSKDVHKICDDCAIKLVDVSKIDDKIRDSFVALIKFLFEETIGTKTFQTATSMHIDDHYEKFIDENEIHVCPFCGLEAYSIPEHRRAEYDHYLPISRYPWLGVNFDNLVPMGDICNGKKNQTDVLYSDRERQNRRKVWYPYEWVPHNISLECTKKPDINDLKGDWKFNIDAKDSSNDEKVNTWRTIFNIDVQFSAMIRRYQKQFVSHFARKNQIAGKNLEIEQLKEELNKYIGNGIGDPKMETMIELRKAWAQYYIDCVDNSQLAILLNAISILK